MPLFLSISPSTRKQKLEHNLKSCIKYISEIANFKKKKKEKKYNKTEKHIL